MQSAPVVRKHAECLALRKTIVSNLHCRAFLRGLCSIAFSSEGTSPGIMPTERFRFVFAFIGRSQVNDVIPTTESHEYPNHSNPENLRLGISLHSHRCRISDLEITLHRCSKGKKIEVMCGVSTISRVPVRMLPNIFCVD